MAQWYDEHGVFHDTDNLAYGDQGDTRYWDGKPGAVGSVAYDRPKDDPGASPAYTVVDSTPGAPPIVRDYGDSTAPLMALLGSGPVTLEQWKEMAVKAAEQAFVEANRVATEAGAELGISQERVSKTMNWIKSNPLWAGLIAIVGMEMLFGGSGRRR